MIVRYHVQVSGSLELSSEMSKMPNEQPAAEGSSSPTGPKQAGAFGRAPKSMADIHSLVRQPLHLKTYSLVLHTARSLTMHKLSFLPAGMQR